MGGSRRRGSPVCIGITERDGQAANGKVCGDLRREGSDIALRRLAGAPAFPVQEGSLRSLRVAMIGARGVPPPTAASSEPSKASGLLWLHAATR